MVQAFRIGVLRSSGFFTKLTKMTPRTMEKAHEEAQKFVNLKRELRLIKKESMID